MSTLDQGLVRDCLFDTLARALLHCGAEPIIGNADALGVVIHCRMSAINQIDDFYRMIGSRAYWLLELAARTKGAGGPASAGVRGGADIPTHSLRGTLTRNAGRWSKPTTRKRLVVQAWARYRW